MTSPAFISCLASFFALFACSSSQPVVHYVPIGSNVFVADGKKYVEKTSRDSIYVSCMFISGTNSQSIFFVEFKNLSSRPFTLDPGSFYLANSENSLSTQYDHSIDPDVKIPLIQEEITYYESHNSRSSSSKSDSRHTPPRSRADAAYQLKYLKIQKAYWEEHVLKKRVLRPNEIVKGDIIFTWTPKNKIAMLHIPTRKDEILFSFNQSLVNGK